VILEEATGSSFEVAVWSLQHIMANYYFERLDPLLKWHLISSLEKIENIIRVT